MVKDKDILILTHFRKNARISLTKLSRVTQIPISTIFDRLRSNEDEVIIKHTSLLDFGKLGFNVKAQIAIKVGREHKDEVKLFLLKHELVNSVYRITNGYDFLIEGIFRGIVDSEEFIDKLQEKFNIIEIKPFFVIEDIMREKFMSDPSMLFEYPLINQQ